MASEETTPVNRRTVYADVEVIPDRCVSIADAVYGAGTDVLEIREYVPSLEVQGKDPYGRGLLIPRVPATAHVLDELIAGLQEARADWPE